MKEIKKPAMFVPLGRITVEGPNEVLQSVANGLNDTKNTSILIMEDIDQEDIGSGQDWLPASAEVREECSGNKIVRFGFQGTKPITQYLAQESMEPANWNHPRNNESDWFWSLAELYNTADFSVSIDFFGLCPEEDVTWEDV